MIEGVSGIEVCRRLRRRAVDRARADHHADRARRGERPHPRARDRRRRLCHQAVQPARAAGAGRRGAPPGAARRWPASSSLTATSKWTSKRIACAAAGKPVQLGPDRVPAAAPFHGASRAACSRANGCSTPSGRTIPTSTRAPSTSCPPAAQGAQRGRPPRPHPHRPLGRLFARRRRLSAVTKVKPCSSPSRRPSPSSTIRTHMEEWRESNDFGRRRRRRC